MSHGKAHADANGGHSSSASPAKSTDALPAHDLMRLHGIHYDQRSKTIMVHNSALTIGQAVEVYTEAQRPIVTPATLRTYDNAARYLIRHFGECKPMRDITQLDMVQWRNSLFKAERFEGHPNANASGSSGGPLSVHTIRRIIGTAAGIFNWMVRLEVIERSPLEGVSRPKAPQMEPKAISDIDIERLITAAGRYHGTREELRPLYERRNTAIVYWLASTGCRVGGLVGAKIAQLHFDDDGATAQVVEKFRGGGKQRTVYLDDLAAIALEEWLEIRPKTHHDKIFATVEGEQRGEPMTTHAVRLMLNRLAKRAGITGKFNPHSFRHAAARRLLQNGASLDQTADILGHTDIRVTRKHYAIWTQNELRDAHKRFNKR